MTSTPLLNLDTLVVRPRITIDGRDHEILSPDELPVITIHMLSSKGQRMDKLLEAKELSDGNRSELAAIVTELSDAIMEPIPADVRAKLSDTQRMAVIEAFSTLLLTRKAGTAAAMFKSLAPPAPISTGEKSSPGSKGSTAGRRGGGSPKRRSR